MNALEQTVPIVVAVIVFSFITGLIVKVILDERKAIEAEKSKNPQKSDDATNENTTPAYNLKDRFLIDCMRFVACVLLVVSILFGAVVCLKYGIVSIPNGPRTGLPETTVDISILGAGVAIIGNGVFFALVLFALAAIVETLRKISANPNPIHASKETEE